MQGIESNGVQLFLGKIPTRKQECFYFVEGTALIPVAYITERNLADAKRLWQKLLVNIPLKEKK